MFREKIEQSQIIQAEKRVATCALALGQAVTELRRSSTPVSTVCLASTVGPLIGKVSPRADGGGQKPAEGQDGNQSDSGSCHGSYSSSDTCYAQVNKLDKEMQQFLTRGTNCYELKYLTQISCGLETEGVFSSITCYRLGLGIVGQLDWDEKT